MLSLDDNDSTPPKSDANDTTVDAAPPNLAPVFVPLPTTHEEEEEEDEESALVAQTQGNLSALLSLMPELSVTAALMPFRIFPGGFPENVTLLAPTDAAWGELMHYSAGLDTMQQLVAQPDFATLLRYHVLNSTVNLSAVEPGARIPTFEVGQTSQTCPSDTLERDFAKSWCVCVACRAPR